MESFKDITQDLGEATFYGITEIWPFEEDDEKLGKMNKRFKYIGHDWR